MTVPQAKKVGLRLAAFVGLMVNRKLRSRARPAVDAFAGLRDAARAPSPANRQPSR